MTTATMPRVIVDGERRELELNCEGQHITVNTALFERYDYLYVEDSTGNILRIDTSMDAILARKSLSRPPICGKVMGGAELVIGVDGRGVDLHSDKAIISIGPLRRILAWRDYADVKSIPTIYVPNAMITSFTRMCALSSGKMDDKLELLRA